MQEAFLRWDKADWRRIDSPPAWLARVVTNLSLNILSSARVRRERYVGPWLPGTGCHGSRVAARLVGVGHTDGRDRAIRRQSERGYFG